MIILYFSNLNFFTSSTFCLFVSIGANQRFYGVRGGRMKLEIEIGRVFTKNIQDRVIKSIEGSF